MSAQQVDEAPALDTAEEIRRLRGEHNAHAKHMREQLGVLLASVRAQGSVLATLQQQIGELTAGLVVRAEREAETKVVLDRVLAVVETTGAHIAQMTGELMDLRAAAASARPPLGEHANGGTP
jgi:predicted phage tail protein